MARYVLWGLPHGETDRLHEAILLGDATLLQIERVTRQATADGWHGFRLLALDGNKPDFRAALNV